MKNLLFLLLCCIACSEINAGIYRDDVPVEKYKALAGQKQFDCVGTIFNQHTDAKGSCVLIGDRYVLSAAHVFIESDTKEDTLRVDGKLWTVYANVNERVADVTKYSFRFNRRQYEGKSMKIFPAYRDSATRGKCDIVLIELAEPVPGVTPALLNTRFDELNDEVIGVGYGASGLAGTPEDVGIYMEKIAGQNTVDTLQGYLLNNLPTILSCDFDHPSLKTLNKWGSEKPLPLEYICSGGDSGGGLFRETKNGVELVGICSGATTDFAKLLKTGYYGQSMHWTRVSAFNSWISETIREMQQNNTTGKK